jgi:hypothetical protein
MNQAQKKSDTGPETLDLKMHRPHQYQRSEMHKGNLKKQKMHVIIQIDD